MTQVTIGADPEFFVKQRTATDEDITPVCGMLGGTKDNPLQIEGMKNGYMMQEDGIAAEFNIPPAENPTDFCNNISNALVHLKARLGSRDLVPTMRNNTTLKASWIEKWPNIEQVGCDPDYNAYEEQEGRVPERVAAKDKVGHSRGAGGHVHIGYNTDFCPPYIVAKACDLMLAIPMSGYDQQGVRRNWWGKAGLYRPKSYGVEYRTLSNFWIWGGTLSKMVAANVISMMESLQNDPISWQAMFNVMNWEAVKNAISMEDHKAAESLFKNFMAAFPVYKAAIHRASDLTYKM